MARPTIWRRARILSLSRGYQDIPLVEITPGETIVRTIVHFACYTGVQPQNTAPDYGIAYALRVIDGDSSNNSGIGSPWSNYYDMEEAVRWGGMTPDPYVYTTAVSPPSEVAVYRPPGGLIDTPTMRLNDTAGVQTLWLQTESSDWQNYTYTQQSYASVLVKLP